MSGTPAIDPSLLELFRSELEVHLPTLNEGLLALEKDPGATAQLEALMRAAHSIKGAARIVGLGPTVQLTHVLEDCFVAAQEGRIRLTGDSVDVLLRAVDLLPRVARPEVDPADVPLVEALVAELKAVQEGKALTPNKEPNPFQEAAANNGTDAAAENIQVPSNLDAASAEALRIRLVNLLRKQVPTIQLDFAKVDHVDPAGLALLAGAARRARSGPRPTRLEIRNAATTVRQLLQQTRLDQLLTVS
jgi:two-component system sensor histidine kinase and response regulator WspE